jgi:hypothetical protein
MPDLGIASQSSGSLRLRNNSLTETAIEFVVDPLHRDVVGTKS